MNFKIKNPLSKTIGGYSNLRGGKLVQKYTSKNTSLNQIPSVGKKIPINESTIILDYGCGKGDKFKNYVEEKGGTYFGYDPFHKNVHENEYALKSNPTIIVCANVLNVIYEDEIIDGIINDISKYGCLVVFQIYEGNKTGIGKPTSKGYQRNEKIEHYECFLSKYFVYIKRKGNVFYCSNFVTNYS